MAQTQPPEIQAILDALELMDDQRPTDTEAISVEVIPSVPASRPLALRDPCAGAFNLGTLSALCASLGAVFRHRAVHHEALTALVGGVINGAIVGSIGPFLPEKNHFKLSSYRTYLLIALCEFGLEIAAQLTSARMGELVLRTDINWGQTIIDQCVGAYFLIGASLTMYRCLAVLGVTLSRNEEDSSLTPAEVVIVDNDIENAVPADESFGSSAIARAI